MLVRLPHHICRNQNYTILPFQELSQIRISGQKQKQQKKGEKNERKTEKVKNENKRIFISCRLCQKIYAF